MSLAPALLLSMPQLVDPNFARTVILLCEHAAEGAFGLVVNRPSEVTAAEAVELEPPIAHPNDLPLLIGGPVEPQRGWILTTAPPEGVERAEVGAGLYLSASPVFLRRVLTSRPVPRRTQVLRRVRRLGARSARCGVGRVGLAHHAGGTRPHFRNSTCGGLGNGDSSFGRGPASLAGRPRRALRPLPLIILPWDVQASDHRVRGVCVVRIPGGRQRRYLLPLRPEEPGAVGICARPAQPRPGLGFVPLVTGCCIVMYAHHARSCRVARMRAGCSVCSRRPASALAVRGRGPVPGFRPAAAGGRS